MNLLARSATNEKPAQPYQEHVFNVLRYCMNNLEAVAPFLTFNRVEYYQHILKRGALCHDVGKLPKKNQDTLADKFNHSQKLPLDHRDAGVQYLLGEEKKAPEAVLVYAHHFPGLPNMEEQINYEHPFCAIDANTAIDTQKNLLQYIELHTQCVGPIPQRQDGPELSAMEYRVLLSCLVDADYSDAGGQRLTCAPTRWEERSRQLDQYIQALQDQSGSNPSNRDQIRRELYENCIAAPTNSPIVYCDSPVGTGKTTAVMAHMLRVAQKQGLRHIFVVLPYTSIITQTVETLRNAVVLEGEDPMEIVAEHHHQADFENQALRHLATTWTSPIIVTTAVQLFETLASNMPAKLRKLHQLVGSGIIIDESHAILPIELMPLAWMWMTQLATDWGCRICLCSATTIKFWEYSVFQKVSPLKPTPLLLPEFSRKLECLENKRIKLNAQDGSSPHFRGVDELICFLGKFHGSKVAVLDTIRSAAYLAKRMQKQGLDVLHLSKALSSQDREAVIDEVKRRLSTNAKQDSDWILIATNCIECGMDFSFHFGFCELRSLHSYFQLSGRVSRNGEYPDGALSVFTITEDEFRTNPSNLLSKDIFQKMIRFGKLPNMTITQAVTLAFKQECKAMGQLHMQLINHEKNRDFAEVAKKFRVIEEDTITVAANQALVQKLRNGIYVSQRELQRGSVNMRKSYLKELGLDEHELPMLGPDQYDSFLGYMKGILAE